MIKFKLYKNYIEQFKKANKRVDNIGDDVPWADPLIRSKGPHTL